ncbi:WW domain-binding protein 11 [Papilio machaon]|uniref:WW domain-binding protein 11 n=1 Tax=Papilio machaon TaxID=76193 RepID=A0A194R503_PAPMA|nr:WW domain-binding protein 11 [Papilio machaon]
MGRRSINTTKSGKYMNPTDQARKEARKKELKKNKKQRQLVRAAVLKMKDPTQILEELQKIDEMEYNVLQPSPLNEKVLKEKRKKLKETFDRVLKMYDKDDPEKWVELKSQEMEYKKRRALLISYYESVKHAQSVQVDDIPLPTLQDKDDPEKWVELKRQEMEYEKRRAHLISYYESVKHAQSVQVDDIPLPTLQVPDNLIYGNVPSQIPLPLDTVHPILPKPILKKDSVYRERPVGIEPPGVPPGPPPNYSVLIFEAMKHESHKEKKSLRFSDFPDEGPPGESLMGVTLEAKVTAPSKVAHEEFDGEAMDEEHSASPPASAHAHKPTSLQQRMLALSGQNIDDFMKEMEEVHKKRERDRAADLNARLNALKRTGGGRDSDSDSDTENHHHMMHHADFALEPPGAEIRQMPPPLLPPGATISAKPQIRNLSADVTRFVPSALRVKREDKKSRPNAKTGALQRQLDVPKAPSKDDAYMQFMKEMEGLL